MSKKLVTGILALVLLGVIALGSINVFAVSNQIYTMQTGYSDLFGSYGLLKGGTLQ